MAQSIIGYSTVDDYSFNKWDIITDDANVVGSIEATWSSMNDYSEWQFTVGEFSGWLRMRHKNNNNVWELVGGSNLIQIRTVFPNEFNHWQLSDGRNRSDLKSVYNNAEEWSVKSSSKEVLTIYTYRRGDLRDWIIEHHGNMSIPMQIANSFLPIIMVTPK